MKLVEITWLDSKQSDGSWRWLDDLGKQKCPKMKSVGWLVQDDKNCKVIAQSMGGDNQDIQVAGCKVIPTACVVKMRKLCQR